MITNPKMADKDVFWYNKIMQRLLLTSSGQFVTNADFDLFGHKPQDLKWLYITTAGNEVKDRSYLIKHKKQLEESRVDYEEMDIAGKDQAYLDKKIAGFDVVYMEGGNTYYLLKMIRQSGFEKVLKMYLNKGLIYIGSSAGSYVCCPTIDMATWKEKVNMDMHDRHGVTDFTAMNLVPFLMFVHYEEKYQDLVKEKQKHINYPLKILNDGQAIKVTDDKVELIGDTKEIIL